MDRSQEGSEDSCRNSVASQHGADGEDGSSLFHHGAEEDHPYQEMDLISPTLEDKHVEGMMFESNMHFLPDIQLRRSQSISSNSSTSLKFPPNNNFGETDNFQEDFEIYLFVKWKYEHDESILIVAAIHLFCEISLPLQPDYCYLNWFS
ncbi:chloride intracellular channel protein 5 isoform x1 [Limosa lapponica baueri]|uniref:Chloride intracellular channel protein 5 isoform x1 n=1 Tax=Limosa lapponica baueri TaxID=1758121 RepID=A0A2I0SZ55_LIMLA|nr:chloride intracellular channel protein 5 isoform x1 [Limosa lapponica baueri]